MRRDYEPDVSQILALYQQLEDDILASMTKRMLKMGYVSESTKYQAEILQSAGLLREDVAEMIAQRTDASVQQVKALFEDAGVETVRIDNEIYREAGVLPIDIRQDEGMRNLLEEGYRRTLGTMQNLVGTTAAQTEQQFISACDRAYMQVSSGAFSYQEAIMTAVRGFADVGAEVVYPSGHRDKLDVAVRRAVLTGVGQATAAVSLKHADEADCDLMELSAHSGARPEHAEWQGQLVSRTGKNAGRTIDGLHVYSLDQIGYGTGRGFKGWNCRHNWYPYYEGFSKPNYTKQQIAALNAKNIPYNGQMYSEYEISQMQRAAERKIRKLKRRLITAQESVKNAPDDATRASAQNYYNRNAVKLKDAEKQLRDFCNQTGQWNDKFRTQVSGFNHSQAQKAVWANRRTASKNGLTNSGGSGTIIARSSGKNRNYSLSDEHTFEKIGHIDFADKKGISKMLSEFEYRYKDSEIEHCIVFTTNGDIYEVHGDKDTVNTEKLGILMYGSINEHNHVIGESQYSFSWADLKTSVKDGTHTMLAYDEKYRYFIVFGGKKISVDDLENAYLEAESEVGDKRQEESFMKQPFSISDEDYQHEIVRRTCEKVGVKYARQSRKQT